MQVSDSVVFTNKAKCRDCYRCVRVCPVKAISMTGDQARVEQERCIQCGTCIRECPQKAKSYSRDLEHVMTYSAEGRPLVCSLAPSMAAVYEPWEIKRLPSALRHLGFRHVGETAVGAYFVAQETMKYMEKHPEKPHIATSCPSVVNYIEIYHPKLMNNLVPVVSPMIAHARRLRLQFGPEVAIIFIGPCVAKKGEARRPEYSGLIDAVLTFEELQEWMQREELDLSRMEESLFDEDPNGMAQLFPLEGGSIKAGNYPTDMLSDTILAISGYSDISALVEQMEGCSTLKDPTLSPSISATASARELLLDIPTKKIDTLTQEVQNELPYKLIEPLFCRYGCIGGPAISSKKNILQRRYHVISYVDEQMKRKHQQASVGDGVSFQNPESVLTSSEKESQDELQSAENARSIFDVRVSRNTGTARLSTSFHARPLKLPPISEADIREVLERIGRSNPEDQLNCGSCGYLSCRRKAVAVLEGMAESQMCVPFMRRRAELQMNRIIETSPNGTVILDRKLEIISMNPAFRRFFSCSDAVLGKPVSYLMDPDPFERAMNNPGSVVEQNVEMKRYNITVHQLIYALDSEHQCVGIFVDVTNYLRNQQQLDQLKEETVRQARELLDQQIRMAENVATALGENTARSESLLEQLVMLAQGKRE